MTIDEAQCSACPECPAESCLNIRMGESDIQGWRMCLAATGLFIAPIAVAIAGAWVLGPGHLGQFIGGVVGLAAGMTGAVVASRLL